MRYFNHFLIIFLLSLPAGLLVSCSGGSTTLESSQGLDSGETCDQYRARMSGSKGVQFFPTLRFPDGTTITGSKTFRQTGRYAGLPAYAGYMGLSVRSLDNGCFLSDSKISDTTLSASFPLHDDQNEFARYEITLFVSNLDGTDFTATTTYQMSRDTASYIEGTPDFTLAEATADTGESVEIIRVETGSASARTASYIASELVLNLTSQNGRKAVETTACPGESVNFKVYLNLPAGTDPFGVFATAVDFNEANTDAYLENPPVPETHSAKSDAGGTYVSLSYTLSANASPGETYGYDVTVRNGLKTTDYLIIQITAKNCGTFEPDIGPHTAKKYMSDGGVYYGSIWFYPGGMFTFEGLMNAITRSNARASDQFHGEGTWSYDTATALLSVTYQWYEIGDNRIEPVSGDTWNTLSGTVVDKHVLLTDQNSLWSLDITFQ